MESEVVSNLMLFLPGLITLVGVIFVLGLINYLIRRDLTEELSVSRQLLMLCLTSAGLLVVIFSLPLSETSRGQILSLFGIVVTAVIALSSTTFVANVMAGLMLRAVNNFRPGDFVRSETFFGRVTERGIFHTEIQSEDRDLITLPNMYLVNNPVTVVHNSGTIISATLSLGYDVSHVQVEELLIEAANETGLEDAFVLVIDLNDFSVSYRVGGFSNDVNRLLTTKSSLRKNILAMIHGGGIEIVSPSFMNQRVLAPKEKISPVRRSEKAKDDLESSPEDMIFAKAGSAAEHEELKQELATAREKLEAIIAETKSSEGNQKLAQENERERLKTRIETLSELLAAPQAGD